MSDIALIRGPHLRPDGIRPWEELAQRDGFDVVAFECNPPVYNTSSVSIPVEQLSWPAATLRDLVGEGRVPSPLRTYLLGVGRLADRFDILHTSENYNIFSFQAALAARNSPDTTFVFSAGQNIPYPLSQRNPIVWKLKQYVNDAAAGITTTTPLGKRALIHEGVAHSQVSVIPNCVDPDQFTPNPDTTPNDVNLPEHVTDGPIILFAHKLCEQKGIPYLLDAYTALQDCIDDLSLILLGTNYLDSEQYQQVETDNTIHHLKRVPYTEMDALYNLADVFVLPSVSQVNNEEQFGMTALEAMACGVPTVVTNIGGLPYVAAQSDTSIVVEERDAVALRGAIQRLIENDELRRKLGSNARERAITVFHPERVADELQEFYESLSTNGSICS